MKLPNWMTTVEQWQDRPIQICLDAYTEEALQESNNIRKIKIVESLDYLTRIRDTLVLNGIKNEPAEEIINKILRQEMPTDKEKEYLTGFIQDYMKREYELRFERMM